MDETYPTPPRFGVLCASERLGATAALTVRSKGACPAGAMRANVLRAGPQRQGV